MLLTKNFLFVLVLVIIFFFIVREKLSNKCKYGSLGGGGELLIFATLNDKSYPLELDSDATVEKLSNVIRVVTGINSNFKMYFGGDELIDNDTLLSDMGIGAESVVNVEIEPDVIKFESKNDLKISVMKEEGKYLQLRAGIHVNKEIKMSQRRIEMIRINIPNDIIESLECKNEEESNFKELDLNDFSEEGFIYKECSILKVKVKTNKLKTFNLDMDESNPFIGQLNNVLVIYPEPKYVNQINSTDGRHKIVYNY